jgi:hypothetical protein
VTIWQYAIARAYKQLAEESERREMTRHEAGLAEVLAAKVEEYEALELSRPARGAKARAAAQGGMK